MRSSALAVQLLRLALVWALVLVQLGMLGLGFLAALQFSQRHDARLVLLEGEALALVLVCNRWATSIIDAWVP